MSFDNRVSFCVYDNGYKKNGEWSLNISSVIIFGRIHIVDDSENANEIYRKLSLNFTSDIDYIDSEIKKFESSARRQIFEDVQADAFPGVS